MNTAGQGQFWERHAGRYDRATLLLNRRFTEMVAVVVDAVRGRGTVVEVAAGTGLVTASLGSAVERLCATDLSTEMLHILRARLRGGLLHKVAIQRCDALHLPFRAATVDAVVAANVLHLLPSPSRALDELRRVLRADGILAVPTFEHGATLLAQSASRVLALAGFPVKTRFRGPMLRQLVEGAGFHVVREVVIPGILPLRCIIASPAVTAAGR